MNGPEIIKAFNDADKAKALILNQMIFNATMSLFPVFIADSGPSIVELIDDDERQKAIMNELAGFDHK